MSTTLGDLPDEKRTALDDLPASTKLVFQVLLSSEVALSRGELVAATTLHQRTVSRATRRLEERDLIESISDPKHPNRNVFKPVEEGGRP